MIRDRLRDMNIKITELADYLGLSRPTMYRYIELYDTGSKSEVGSSTRKLFNYIEKHPLVGKNNVIRFLLSEQSARKSKEDHDLASLIKYVKENRLSDKTKFMQEIISNASYDRYIRYLLEAVHLLGDESNAKENNEFLEPLKMIDQIYSSNKKGGN